MEILRPSQLETAAKTLAEAFWDDPLMHIVAPNENRRAAVGPWFFLKALTYGIRWGQASCNDDASAVAIWFPPGNTDIKPGRMLRVGMGALPLRAGINGTVRFMRALSATEKFHKAVEGPHWYLMAIGTSPARQGTGLGNALLELGTSQADAAGIPCYLETATESNVAFYSKRGFEVTGQTNVLGFTLRGMVRQPARAPAES
jgi:ribosomal protein S18 acetylase RimI-like enzyme